MASASTFRGSTTRRTRTAPAFASRPRRLGANQPEELAKVLKTLEGIRASSTAPATGGKKVSLAYLIVLGGAAGVELARRTPGTR